MGSVFSSGGYYLPEKIITNDDLSRRYATDFDLAKWIAMNLGVYERRQSDLLPSEQGAIAARMALAKVAPEVDFIIVNTINGDYTIPQTATLIQQKLGLENAFAFEINMPCAGPIYSICIAHMMLQANKYKRGLLIGVDKVIDLLHPMDYLMNALFGDGAGALIIEASEEKETGVIDFYLGSAVGGSEEANYPLRLLAGKAKYPIGSYDNEGDGHYLVMEAKKVKHFIEEKLSESVEWLLKHHIASVEEIDYIITHQANKKVIENCLGAHGIDKGKILFTVDYFGNTCSASVFMTITKYFDCFKTTNKKTLICGMGAGLTWGSIYYRT